MARVNGTLAELYMNSLKDGKPQPPASFDDTSRGVLLALIKDRPTIWNSSAKLTKDDVLASFRQCSSLLSNMNPEFTLYAIIEKWCWVSEAYMRCLAMNPQGEWRYNNALDFLKPFNSPSYPYLGCLSKNRLDELTKLYADAEVTKIMESTENFESPPGIFREEMALFAGEDFCRSQFEAEILAKTVGQVVNAKRRGRPSKIDKRSPTDLFINLTPQSAQFQKLLESNGSTPCSSSSSSDTDSTDEFGLTPALYTTLIDMIKEKPEIWKKGSGHVDHSIFEDFAKELAVKFIGRLDKTVLDRLTGPYVHNIWDRLKKKFAVEDCLENSRWRYYQQLQFLSTRLMSAYLFDNIFIKSEDPSTSSSRAAVASPAGSSQSEDSRMASSPATVAQMISLPGGNKSIQAVLENLVRRNEANGGNAVSSTNTSGNAMDYSELRQLLDSNKVKLETDEGPSAKRIKQETPPPSSSGSSSRTIVYQDRGSAQPFQPVSTWVPPREDLNAKSREEPVPSTPKRAQATAVIRSGNPLEKQLKKILQQGNPLIPVTGSSLQGRTGLVNLNPTAFQQQTALQQALSLKKVDPPVMATLPTVSTSQAIPFTNGTLNAAAEPEDKWALMGRMITMISREVESRDPMAAFELYRDLQQVICASQIKSYQSSSSSSNPSSSSQ